jgi:hypothetical protein
MAETFERFNQHGVDISHGVSAVILTTREDSFTKSVISSKKSVKIKFIGQQTSNIDGL